ncbi:MAG: 3,4-dihydroxy-2-butanone-4-phosphate synthase [Desulfobacterales bacterium]|nr:3,4-dihydroxy-2-butanone-4-phosphate synthase [Desulfobacterales bacterium]
MNQSLLDQFGSPEDRVKMAVISLRNGNGVLITQGDAADFTGYLIFTPDSLNQDQTALLIKECSGFISLCMDEAKAIALGFSQPPGENENTNRFSMDASRNIGSGVSAGDRLATIQAAAAPNAEAGSISTPGHVFAAVSKSPFSPRAPKIQDAVLQLMAWADLPPLGVCSQLLTGNGNLADLPQVIEFGMKQHIPVITMADLANRLNREASRAS